MSVSFQETLIRSMELWVEENPDVYVNPYNVVPILQCLDDQGYSSDVLDEWCGGLWRM